MFKTTPEVEMFFLTFMEEMDFCVQIFIIAREEEESTVMRLVIQLEENGWKNR